MGDGLKLSKDKRHRSSSSLAGTKLDVTRSDRRLEMNASIPEIQDQFAAADACCEDLQEKLNLIKSLKKRRKLKKRSMTRVTEQPPSESNPFITVRTQPKKKVLQASRRLEARGYMDPATLEQHRMLGQVRGYHQAHKQPQQVYQENLQQSLHPKAYGKSRREGSQPDGDRQSVQINTNGPLEECGHDEIGCEPGYDGYDEYDRPTDFPTINNNKKSMGIRSTKPQTRRRHTLKDEEHTPAWRGSSLAGRPAPPPLPQRRQPADSDKLHKNLGEERSVVEIFTKSKVAAQDRALGSAPLARERHNNKGNDPQSYEELSPDNDSKIEFKKDTVSPPHPRRVRYRSRRYELPTVASQMKQSGTRYCYQLTNTNIPFVVTKSTAPSHNIGVNIQQVLNGLKIQQPLSGIPLTIAHHMGLGHIPNRFAMKSVPLRPSLDPREINAIKVGRRLVRLPSYKYMSYNQLLSLYREGDGMVPRFLKAISRPHYFYSSMYNLPTHQEVFEAPVSKTHDGSHEAKQSLAEYASLYHEYEKIDKRLKEKYDPELEKRREELTKELAAREKHIRRVVQEYRAGEADQLRASASTADETYHRQSSYKLHEHQ